MAEGIIMKALSGFYYVDDGKNIVTCRGRGKLRRDKVTPLVGDRVRLLPPKMAPVHWRRSFLVGTSSIALPLPILTSW